MERQGTGNTLIHLGSVMERQGTGNTLIHLGSVMERQGTGSSLILVMTWHLLEVKALHEPVLTYWQLDS